MTAAAVKPLRLAVLISGRGSNMLAIARACREGREGRIPAEIVTVLSDVPGVAGLDSARELGLAADCIDAGGFRPGGRFDKPAFEAALSAAIDASQPDLIILAGFMRVLSPAFTARYAGRLLNIHPSLLPAYKGLHTHERVLESGDAWHGVTVHFVTAELDGGPLLGQARVPVLAGDDVARLSARVQRQEHILFPTVIDWIARGRLRWNNGSPQFDGVALVTPRMLPDAQAS
ncbi:MAG: phosphoribosylglycinamide formyltransferase 1 [Pseudomonadota bacterium]|jgi:phosphoribosylglycinamide formyltransferase-1